MSLHLGNLSSRIRGDELERIFQRFGWCTVRIKDKFGIVVYDYPKNAERALKTLRGKLICGEPIHLSWSNRQLRPCRNMHEELNPMRQYERGTLLQRFMLIGRMGKRLSADLMDEACHKNMKDYEEHHSLVENIPDHSGGVVVYLSENDRWQEQVINPMKENVLEDGLDFDRYEPDKADGPKGQNIFTHKDGSTSPSLRNPTQRARMKQIERITRNHSNDLKAQNACYNCGETGHSMRKCPQGIKRFESRTSRRLRAGQETVPLKMIKGRGEAIDSRNGHRLRGESSPSARATHRGGRNNHRENKRCWNEQGNFDMFHPKKDRVSKSPSNHSNKTVSQSRSTSRSVRSPTSSSQSGSTTLHNKSKSFKRNTMSMSSSPKSSSSTGKVQIDQKDSFENAGDPQSKRVLFEGEPLENSAARLDASELENVTIELKENVEDDHFCRRDAIDIGRDSCQGKFFNTTGSDICDLKACCASPKSLKTRAQNRNSGLTVSERLHATDLTSLSSEEVYRVLKHYGLENQDKRENEWPAETYFGCSRLWPWEIIYYRRLTKGLISTKNYSRRLEQNKKFGMVDKFVRSSSGWGELKGENS
ncbi:unnamed protein product [Withania somnifera]